MKSRGCNYCWKIRPGSIYRQICSCTTAPKQEKWRLHSIHGINRLLRDYNRWKSRKEMETMDSYHWSVATNYVISHLTHFCVLFLGENNHLALYQLKIRTESPLRHSAVSIQFLTSVSDLIKTWFWYYHGKTVVYAFFVGFDLISMDLHPVDREFHDEFLLFFTLHQASLIRNGPKYLVSFFQVEFCQWFYLYSNVNVNFIIFPLSHTPKFGFYFYRPTTPHSIRKETRVFCRNNSHR